MKKAFSYIRFSTAKQAAGDSLRRQTETAERLAAENGYTLDDSFNLRDLGISAYKGDNADTGALGAFIRAVELGKVEKGSALIVENLDRLARSELSAALELFLALLRHGVVIITPRHKFTNASINDVGNIMAAILEFTLAHDESVKKSDRLSAAWQKKRNNAGKTPITSRCPAWLTLNKETGKFDVDESKARIVRRVFECTIDGYGSGSMAKLFNKDRIPLVAERAGKWAAVYIQLILRNRAVLGEFQPHTGSNKNKDRKKLGEPIKDYFPRIVSDVLFDKAQGAIAARTNQRGRKSNFISNVFQGLIKGQSSNWVLNNKSSSGRERPKQLVEYAALCGAAKFISFPYPAFEKALLEYLGNNLKPNDLGYEVEDPTAALTGKLDMINARLGKIRQAMGKFGELETLAGAAADLELERVKLIKEIDTARQTVPASSVLNELKISIDLFFINPPYLESKGGIIETLANTPTDKIKETRQRLQQKIRQLIDGIYMTVEVQPKGNIRTASVAIKFKGQKAFMQEIDITTVNGKLDGWAIVNKRTVPSKTRKTA